VDLQAEEMHGRGNLTFKNLFYCYGLNFPKNSTIESNVDSRLNCEPKKTHFPVEGHMGQMLLHLRSAHKSHDVRENKDKLLSYQILLRHHSDLLDLRCKAIHHHCSLKTVNYTPRLQAAKDKKRDKDNIRMAKDSESQNGRGWKGPLWVISPYPR